MRRLLAFSLLALLGGSWAVMTERASDSPAGGRPIAVAVTIAPQAWVVEQIGGDRVSVTTLVGPGESPATYLPTDAQVSQVLRSVVYFRIGVPSEEAPWLDAIRRSGVDIVDLRDGVELLRLPRGHHSEATGREAPNNSAPEKEDHHGAGYDPHIWLSPRRLGQLAGSIADHLSRLDPPSAGLYRKRLERFEQRVESLDAELETKLAKLAGRAFLVFHPAWGYFAHDYGLRQLAVEVEGKEPSESEVTELQAIARREGIRAVFVQPQIQGRSAQGIAEAIDGRTEVLDPLQPDVLENLSRVGDRISRAVAGP